jgi:hypothetical protein
LSDQYNGNDLGEDDHGRSYERRLFFVAWVEDGRARGKQASSSSQCKKKRASNRLKCVVPAISCVPTLFLCIFQFPPYLSTPAIFRADTHHHRSLLHPSDIRHNIMVYVLRN